MEIKSKVVGTTFYKEGGIPAIERAKADGVTSFIVDRDTNVDPDGLALYAPIKDAYGKQVGTYKVGHIRNSERRCVTCGKKLPGSIVSKIGKCPTCGGVDWQYDGLASELTVQILKGKKINVRVEEYTGGEGKNTGCNIVIDVE